MVAVDVNRTWEVTHRTGDLRSLLFRNPVVADGQMDVAEAVLAGTVEVRAGAINGNYCLDAESSQGSKAFVSIGAAAAV